LVRQTRKLLLRLTKQAKESLGIDSSVPEYGSLVHEYWKRFFGKKFEKKGYKIDYEVPRPSGRVDVVAYNKDETIAIEIETGKSNIIRNIQQDLAAKYDKVVVAATDKKALAKVEKELSKAGLLGIERIEVIMV
jgi:hypothetical protein